MTAPLTDREAIKRLADILHAMNRGDSAVDLHEALMELTRDLAEPAAPTVTREQEETFAERVVQLIEENANDDLRDEMNRDQPAFFRAVADQLDKP
jgi:hypothetical protein